jgi:hypothetical protein
MCMRFRADSKRGRMQDFPLSQNGEPPSDTVNSLQPGWENEGAEQLSRALGWRSPPDRSLVTHLASELSADCLYVRKQSISCEFETRN